MEAISLLELNQKIKDTLAQQLAPSYWVIAEIGEIRVNFNGHCYLELVEKEDNQTLAKSKATIWSYQYKNLNGWFEAITGSPLSQGMKILANVQVTYHELYGLSLNIRDIDPKYTLGERERKKQETIAKLIAEGVLEMNKLHDLPQVVQKIAVISSPTAAGWEDFQHTIANSAYIFELSLFQATLQGDAAIDSIISALNEVARHDFDALVIIRGGGAQMDLDTFNDFDLCNHIAQFPIPVITGIGHERDQTIADIVANISLKTPTAVAEFLISRMEDFISDLQNNHEAIKSYAHQTLSEHTWQLERFQQQLKSAAKNLLYDEKAALSQLKLGLNYSSGIFSTIQKNKLQNQTSSLHKGLKTFMESEQKKLKLNQKIVALSDPSYVLARGYSITLFEGKLINKNAPNDNNAEIITISENEIYASRIVKRERRDGKKRIDLSTGL